MPGARQVALAFLLRHPDTFVIPKASDMAHVEENAGAAALELSAAEVERIASVFPAFHNLFGCTR